jgi:hypothetical protein
MADKRISGLPAISSAAREDLLLVVDDPAGTPSNKKVSLTQFFSNVEPEIVFANTKALASSSNASVIFKGGVAIQNSMKVDTDLTVNVTAILNIATINSLSSALIGTTNAIYDLGNTTIGWGNAYVGIIKGDTDDNLLITANTNASANIIFTGANVHIKSNSIVAGTNTVITSNATFSGANVIISGTNSHVTSNTTIAGTNSTFTANATFSGANVIISGTNSHVTSNTTIAGTNTVATSNATFSGANVSVLGTNAYFTSNSTFAGTDQSITANISMAGTNTHITSQNLYSSANATLEGTNTKITSNVSATANVSLTSVIDSSSNTTGALTVAGGVGILKSATIGENLTVHGNIHADGNITAEGGTLTFGNADTDTVVFEADVGSDLIPNIDSTYDLGNTTHRFSNAYIDDIVVTGNVAVTGNVSAAFGSFSDNVSIGTDKSLTFRDATLEINSPADGELELASDDLITFTATANVEIDSAVFNVASNSTIAGTNTAITSNVTISGANTNLSSANLSITGAGATIDGTLMNVKSNVVMSGITTLGVDGSGKNFTLYSSTAGNKIRLKALTDQFVSNTQIESSEKIRTDGHVFVSNDSSLVFGSQFKIMDTSSTTGFLLQEDGTAAGSGTEGGRVDLETAEEARLTHNSTAGFGFSDNLDITGNVNVTSTTDSTSTITGSIKTAGGIGIAASAWIGGKVYAESSLALAGAICSTGYVGDGAGIFAIKNGTAPTVQGADQAYLYAKDDVSESHIYTMDEGGNETKLGPHNENNEWEFYSRNVKTGKVMRVNMERMIRKLEEFTGDTFIEEN